MEAEKSQLPPEVDKSTSSLSCLGSGRQEQQLQKAGGQNNTFPGVAAARLPDGHFVMPFFF